jgi:hypothetical protein
VKVSDGLDPMSKMLPVRMDVRLDSLKLESPIVNSNGYGMIVTSCGLKLGAARDSVRGSAFGVTSSPS